MTRRLILGFALFALVVGYVEMRLPDSVSAQGRDAVYQRLATGVLKFETPLTPTMTARLAATGTASAATFLRGDGAWDPLENFRGLIAAFNGSCPSGWREMTALRGRMIVGLVDGGTLNATSGLALTNVELRRGGTAHARPQIQGYRSSVNWVNTVPALEGDWGSESNRFLIRYDNNASPSSSLIWIAPGRINGGGGANQRPPAPYIQLRYCEYYP